MLWIWRADIRNELFRTVDELLQFLVEPPDRESDHVVVIASDFFYMDGEIALYAVGSCLVKGIPGFHISAQVVLVDRVEGHVGFLVKCVYGSSPTFSHYEGNAGVDLVGAVREHGEHVVSLGLMGGFSEDLAPVDNDGVRADDGEVFSIAAVRRRRLQCAEHGLGFLGGKLHDDVGRYSFCNFFLYGRRDSLERDARLF